MFLPERIRRNPTAPSPEYAPPTCRKDAGRAATVRGSTSEIFGKTSLPPSPQKATFPAMQGPWTTSRRSIRARPVQRPPERCGPKGPPPIVKIQFHGCFGRGNE